MKISRNRSCQKTGKGNDTEAGKKMKREKEKFRNLHGKQKIQYIWDYYKLPMVICAILLYIAGYCLYGAVTHKDVVLYTALVNVNAGDDLIQDLSSRFLEDQKTDPSKNELYLYSGLYLTDDEDKSYHQYTYASRMKILGAIDGEQMDVVLMNKEAFDAFSQNGYLCDLEKLLSRENPALYETLKPDLVTGTVILEDNAMDLYFDDSLTYSAKTESYMMGLDLSACPAIARAGFGEPVYLGIIANSPRKDTAVTYLDYLY